MRGIPLRVKNLKHQIFLGVKSLFLTKMDDKPSGSRQSNSGSNKTLLDYFGKSTKEPVVQDMFPPPNKSRKISSENPSVSNPSPRSNKYEKLLTVPVDLAKKTILDLKNGYFAGSKIIPPAKILPMPGAKPCILHQKGGTWQNNEYVKTKVHGWGDSEEFYIHHLALVAVNLVNDFKFNEGYQVEHRCHRKRCIEETHLRITLGSANINSNVCNGTYLFKCHCCRTWINGCRCPERRCILPLPPEFNGGQMEISDYIKMRVVSVLDYDNLIDYSIALQN